jgi:hypothetical protein
MMTHSRPSLLLIPSHSSVSIQRLEVEVVDLLLLSISVVLGTSSGDAGLVVEGLSSAERILQVLDLAYDDR